MNILLAIDSSAGSEIAVNEVIARPWPEHTLVHVLSVVEYSRFFSVPELVEADMDAAQELVKSAAARLAPGGLDITTAVVQGHVQSSIIEYAEEWGADFVIIGSHGHGVVERFLLGGVARVVIRHAPYSVEIVRGRKPGRAGVSTGLRILLATDGSDCSIAAARSVAGRPWPKASEIRIVSAPDVLVPAIDPWDLDPQVLDRLREVELQYAREAVAKVRDIVSGTELNVSDAIPAGSPKSVILDEAKNWGADLIVVGSHGRRGISRFLLGSVAEAVALHSECSVEVIRERATASS